MTDRSLRGAASEYLRYGAVVLALGLFVFGVVKLFHDNEKAVGVIKTGIALAAGGLFLEPRTRAPDVRRERWRRFTGITLGLAAIVAYYHGFHFKYPHYYHRHDQYHYYLGAKYFPELGYNDLYKCTVVAEDELGTVRDVTGPVDVTKENRRAGRKIRNLGADNLLTPVAQFLEHPEECKGHFSPERWAAFKDDVQFFRSVSDRVFWERMQSDHGFNPPPVWLLAGRAFASLFPAGHTLLGFVWLQWLAQLDNVLIAAMFAALWWAFGWRVFVVAAVFWGCNAPGDDTFVSGAFLRQDWLFFFVLSACLCRKRWFVLAGASLVTAALLRLFPGLAAIGWLVVAGAYFARHKRIAKSHKQILLGGALAAAVLVPASAYVCTWEAYPSFFRHTIQLHNETPLTNDMGLRVLIAHSPFSGRAVQVKDDTLADPFLVWKRMRNARYYRYRPVAYAVIALSATFFLWVVRRVKSTWIALALGQIFLILLAQLTSYYYAFLVISAPLTRAKRAVVLPLLGLAALSQLVWKAFGSYDDRSAVMSLLSLLFCYWLLFVFADQEALDALCKRAKAIVTRSA